MYEGQELISKGIGVDTARYLLEVDGKSDVVKTGGDGYWGNCMDFYNKQNQKSVLAASVISICMPDFTDFEGMQMDCEQQEQECSQIKME